MFVSLRCKSPDFKDVKEFMSELKGLLKDRSKK